MLLTGIRTPLGIKLYGEDIKRLEEFATKIESALRDFNSTLSVSSDKINSGYYLDIELNEESMSRYGLRKSEILDFISYLVGGQRVSTLYKGVERYAITLRLEADQREDLTTLGDLMIRTKEGAFPLSMFAKLSYKEGPSVIKSEKGMNVNFIYITPKSGVTSDTYKKEASKIIEKINLPEGYYIEWAGQSEYLDEAKKRLKYIIPLSLVLIFLLIYFAIGKMRYAVVIFLTLPLALLGGLVYVSMLKYNISIAVVVGFLSLLGVGAETSIVMVIYLLEEHRKLGDFYSKDELISAIKEGAVMRLRPKLMTVFAIISSLLPIMMTAGVGSEVMQRIAAPMIGGMVSSTLLTLIVVPVVFYMLESKNIRRKDEKI
jgi:Cu(I)/Ag(I) efflux system membrane protein CusA/SilA